MVFLAAIGGASAAACDMEAPDFEQEETALASGPSRVGARELRAATDRIRKLRSSSSAGLTAGLGPNSSGFLLDVRDREQKKYVETRLRYVGKTPENSPNLFARLERKSMAGAAELLDGGADDCANPLSVTQNPSNPNRWEARIITSCFAGADYSYVDLFWWNTLTGETLASDFREDFANPTDLTLEIEADAAAIGTTIQVDSMAINARGAEDYFAFADIIQERPDMLAARDNVFHPADQVLDNVVVVCLDRGGADCDYLFMGTNANVMMPISMNFRFPGTVTSIVRAVGQIHMTDTGGVCQTADLKNFVTASGAVVALDTRGPISFGPKCVDNQVSVRFWVEIVTINSRGQVYSMYWANDRPNDPKNFAMQFRWSCLAEGSKIVMADGTEKVIEQIEVGDRIRTGAGSAPLSVVDISKGFESAPIVDLETDSGAKLMVTQGHPLFGADGAALRADALEVGSTIKTSTGEAKVTKLGRRPFAGHVYNLKLGTDDQLEGLDVARINMYANGLSVGDARSQWALEMVRQQGSSAPIRDEWMADALMASGLRPASN
jgi:hypothetical protein